MQVHMSLKVPSIKADSYEDACEQAHKAIHWWILDKLALRDYKDFKSASLTHKNTDGTYTVTVP